MHMEIAEEAKTYGSLFRNFRRVSPHKYLPDRAVELDSKDRMKLGMGSMRMV